MRATGDDKDRYHAFWKYCGFEEPTEPIPGPKGKGKGKDAKDAKGTRTRAGGEAVAQFTVSFGAHLRKY